MALILTILQLVSDAQLVAQRCHRAQAHTDCKAVEPCPSSRVQVTSSVSAAVPDYVRRGRPRPRLTCGEVEDRARRAVRQLHSADAGAFRPIGNAAGIRAEQRPRAHCRVSPETQKFTHSSTSRQMCVASVLQVRFDMPATPLAFVQSSGRARVLQSHMVLMLQSGNEEHIMLLRSLRGCA